MFNDAFPRPGWLRASLFVAVWTLLGLFNASHSYIQYASKGDPVPWYCVLAMGLSLWYSWGVLSLFVSLLAWRFPLDYRHWPGRLLIHLVACVCFALVKLCMDYPIIKTFYCSEPEKLSFGLFYRMGFTGYFHTYVLTYWAILGVCHALNYYHKYRERELLATQLDARLTHAQLHLLKMQLHPHFLFNTLNAISALVRRDADKAEHMLTRLGDLLRLTLEHAGAQEVALSQELEFVEAYLDIEQIRFGSRLTVRTQIDPEARDARVPYLVLQPLVENAVRHGIAPYPKPGCIEIGATREHGHLRLQVADNGPGLPKLPANGLREGIGLGNTRARLQGLYGPFQRLELGSSPAGGLAVTVEIPFAVEEEGQSRAGIGDGTPARTGRRLARLDGPFVEPDDLVEN